MPPPYYEILGVSPHATSEQIEAAFKSKASEVHPDRVSPANPYLKNVAAEAFKNLSEAKSVLLDAGKRQKYDAELAHSRGSSTTPPAGAGPASTAPDAAASTAPTPAASTRPPHAFSWLVNTTAGLMALSIACATLLLAGGVILYRSQTPPPTQITPAANPGPTVPCNSHDANCADSSTVPRPAGIPEASQTGTKSHATPTAQPRASTPSRVQGSNPGKPRTVIQWKASDPPDLSALSASERQAIESACSYALLESPDEHNGCLAKELARRSGAGNFKK